MYYKRQQHKEFDIFIMLPRARQQDREGEWEEKSQWGSDVEVEVKEWARAL